MADEKHVDESWKESIESEKRKAPEGNEPQASKLNPGEFLQGPEASGGEDIPEMNFISYLTSLAIQAMIFLGEIPNPITNATEKHLDQAKLLIDTLAMLKEKTEGNLNDEENNALNNFLYELQMKYVEIAQKG